mmetsp:Transcript_20119/g.47451  ORF Transcript_20119/g.47451 Transcript_20119/m.47451 type:complete len:188 (+) Transcript_20119:254-817(+)
MEEVKKLWREQVDSLAMLWANKRQFAYHTLKLLMIVLAALMIWKGLMVYTNSESPVVVVLSGSMEPTFQRGDILFLDNNYDKPMAVGEIVVFKLKGRDIPIVHRIHRVYQKEDGTQEYLTKGDNNHVHDQGMYMEAGQTWLQRDDILGRSRGFLPYIGMVTVLLTDYPWLKFLLIGVMGLFVLTSRE